MIRIREPELMDDPNLDESLHQEALASLKRFNRLGLSHKILYKPLVELSKSMPEGRPLKVLDIATGLGDIPIELAREAKRDGLNIEVFGSDFSPRSVQFATENAKASGVNVEFFKLDVIKDEFPKDFDVITSSLFFHHLDPEHIVPLLSKMFSSAKSMVLVSDLERSRHNLALVWLLTRVATTSSVVKYDGPVSVRAAYKIDEMKELARDAGCDNVTFTRHFPCRYLLRWQK